MRLFGFTFDSEISDNVLAAFYKHLGTGTVRGEKRFPYIYP